VTFLDNNDLPVLEAKIPRLSLALEKSDYISGEVVLSFPFLIFIWQVINGVAFLSVGGNALDCSLMKVEFKGGQEIAKNGNFEYTKDIVCVAADIGLVS
jgi:hypothetical protein